MGVASEDDLHDFLSIPGGHFARYDRLLAFGVYRSISRHVMQGRTLDDALEEHFGVTASATWSVFPPSQHCI